MSGRIHIVIDNTFPKSLARELGDFWRSQFPHWTVRHESDVAKCSTKDSHWIPKLREIESDGEWLIITADSGKNDRKHSEKLPVICKNHDHAYLVVSSGLTNSAQFKAAISSQWPSLPKIITASKALKRDRLAHAKLGFRGNKETPDYVVRVRGKLLGQDVV